MSLSAAVKEFFNFGIGHHRREAGEGRGTRGSTQDARPLSSAIWRRQTFRSVKEKIRIRCRSDERASPLQASRTYSLSSPGRAQSRYTDTDGIEERGPAPDRVKRRAGRCPQLPSF